MTRNGIAVPVATLVIGAIAMGVSPIFVRLADVGPFTSAFWRVALALPVLYAWMRLSERQQRLTDYLNGKSDYHVVSANGTDIRMSVAGWSGRSTA